MERNTRKVPKGNTSSHSRDRDKQDDTDTGEREVERHSENTIKLDRWQEEVLATKCEHNIALRAGRQVGKSTIIAELAGEKAVSTPKTSIMIISATERQAYLLFSKVLSYIYDNHKKEIRTGKDRKSGAVMRPTKTQINLKNGSIIRCLPTGLDGMGIRGYTVDVLIADEAAFCPEDVWPAITPMISTTGGKIILLSTPFGKLGYFYDRFRDDDFLKWHINAEDVAEGRAEPQRTWMKHHHKKEQDRMTELQYAQEYKGDFVDDLRRIFSDDIIRLSCIIPRDMVQGYRDYAQYYMGVDIARMGEDAGTFEILRRDNPNYIVQVANIVQRKKYTTETFDRILELNRQWNFKRIGLDVGSGSLGVGIMDFLLREPSVRNKLDALNNRQISLDHRGERRRQLLKEDLYFNMLAMMEKGILKLLDDDEVIASLRSIQYEYIKGSGKRIQLKIFGIGAGRQKIDHITEGLVRAAFLANQKHLNLQITYI